MTPFRRPAPPQPSLRPLNAVWLTALALSLTPFASQAQGLATSLEAANPGTVTAPAPSPMPVMQPVAQAEPAPASDAEARQQWRALNDRVAAFPRGHIDILRWEAKQLRGTSATPSAAAQAPTPLTADDVLRASLRVRPNLWQDPTASAIAQAQLSTAWAQHQSATRSLWLEAVSAKAMLNDQTARSQLADDAVELGQRMVKAGNWSQARLMREQLTQAQERAALISANQAALEAGEALARWMGVWAGAEVQALVARLPAQLPALPAQAMPGADLTTNRLETAALAADRPLQAQRQAAQRDLAAMDARWSADWEGAVDAALAGISLQTSAPPLLASPSLRNSHSLQQSADAAADLMRASALRRSQARVGWARLQQAHALAQQASEVVLPLQTALEQETLQRYNGMLQSTWELLDASRARLQAQSEATRSLADFWRLQADWQAFLAGADLDISASAASATGSAPTTSAQGH